MCKRAGIRSFCWRQQNGHALHFAPPPPQFDQPDHRFPRIRTSPVFTKILPHFPVRKSVRPKIFRTIAAKSGKTPVFFYRSDGVHTPPHIPARPIEPGTPALKFRPQNFFLIESCRAENFLARNLKNRKNFGLKVENFKKSWRESWKKGC